MVGVTVAITGERIVWWWQRRRIYAAALPSQLEECDLEQRAALREWDMAFFGEECARLLDGRDMACKWVSDREYERHKEMAWMTLGGDPSKCLPPPGYAERFDMRRTHAPNAAFGGLSIKQYLDGHSLSRYEMEDLANAAPGSIVRVHAAHALQNVVLGISSNQWGHSLQAINQQNIAAGTIANQCSQLLSQIDAQLTARVDVPMVRNPLDLR